MNAILDWVWGNIWTILFVINYILAFAAMIFILLNTKSSAKMLAYFLALIFIPFLSIFIYYFFGVEYRKQKIFAKDGIYDSSVVQEWHDKYILNEPKLEEMEQGWMDEMVKMVRLVQTNQNSPLTFNNDVQLLQNGENKFPKMLDDIKEAQHHIHLEYYILVDDDLGNQIIDAIIERAQAGVAVRMSYDGVGGSVSSQGKRRMKEAGVEFFPFMPVRFSNLTRKANFRNHRKICVIDGKVGYIGGINISKEYSNDYEKDNKYYWRDSHLRIEGDAVKSIQAQWLLTWNFVSGTELEIEPEFFPDHRDVGDFPVQIAAAGPDTDWPTIMEAIFTAITTAEEYVYLTTPYFIPNESIITALCSAARGGVDVRLMVPKEGDSAAAKYASQGFFEMLLRSGVKIYQYHRGMLHSKCMVVDDEFTTIGTSNMDNRSFMINFEINALIYHKEFAVCNKESYFEDVKDCEEIDPDTWYNRGWKRKMKESLWRLWAPLL